MLFDKPTLTFLPYNEHGEGRPQEQHEPQPQGVQMGLQQEDEDDSAFG